MTGRKANPAARLYAPIWHKLKVSGECRIMCSVVEARRIKKAVIKEKWMDSDFRDAAPFAKLEIHMIPSGILFKLHGLPLLQMKWLPDVGGMEEIEKRLQNLQELLRGKL